AHVVRSDLEFEDGALLAIGLVDGDLIGIVDQRLGDLFDQGPHVPTLLAHTRLLCGGVIFPVVLTAGLGYSGGGRKWFRDDLADSVRHFGALGNPIIDALALELNAGGVGTGIVSSHDLDRAAIARAFLLDHHHAIMRLFARTRARQTDH